MTFFTTFLRNPQEILPKSLVRRSYGSTSLWSGFHWIELRSSIITPLFLRLSQCRYDSSSCYCGFLPEFVRMPYSSVTPGLIIVPYAYHDNWFVHVSLCDAIRTLKNSKQRFVRIYWSYKPLIVTMAYGCGGLFKFSLLNYSTEPF